MSASCALQASISPSQSLASAYRRKRRVPDLSRVFGNCAVGREPTDVGGVDDARTHPALPLSPGRVDADLRFPIGVKIGAQHEIVVMGQCIDETAVAAGVVVREDARGDLVERLA